MDCVVHFVCGILKKNKSEFAREDQPMKKVLRIGSGIVGMLFVILGSVIKVKENTDVSIVGGVDGPKSVFVAAKLNGDLAIILILIGIVMLAIAVIVYLKRKH